MTTAPVALITGASQRLGGAIANALHQQGYSVIIHYRHSENAAQTLSAQFNNTRKDSSICLYADLDNPTEQQELCQQALDDMGKVNLLVNNASNFFATPIGHTSAGQWDDLFNSNSKAPFFLSQALAPTLAEHNGSIINMIDIHANAALKNHTLYCMAKSALKMMTLSLAKELAPDIRVNGIAPGAILWPKPEQDMTAKEKQKILQEIPLQRLGTLEEIANTAVFLATSDYITGQIIAVDGGRSL